MVEKARFPSTPILPPAELRDDAGYFVAHTMDVPVVISLLFLALFQCQPINFGFVCFRRHLPGAEQSCGVSLPGQAPFFRHPRLGKLTLT
jgi:hypothetical protein